MKINAKSSYCRWKGVISQTSWLWLEGVTEIRGPEARCLKIEGENTFWGEAPMVDHSK